MLPNMEKKTSGVASGILNDSMDSMRMNPRRSKLDCPRFDGYDFLGWRLKVEQFFKVVNLPEEDKVPTVMIHLDGKTLQWHQRFAKSKGPLKSMEWNGYLREMRARFYDYEYSDPMAELVSLKQTTTVEDFYEKFETLLNLLNLSDDYALSIFLSNLKPDIANSVKLFYPKNITYALNLAKQVEAIVYNVPKKHFIHPKSGFVTSTPSYSPQTDNNQTVPTFRYYPLHCEAFTSPVTHP